MKSFGKFAYPSDQISSTITVVIIVTFFPALFDTKNRWWKNLCINGIANLLKFTFTA